MGLAATSDGRGSNARRDRFVRTVGTMLTRSPTKATSVIFGGNGRSTPRMAAEVELTPMCRPRQAIGWMSIDYSIVDACWLA